MFVQKCRPVSTVDVNILSLDKQDTLILGEIFDFLQYTGITLHPKFGFHKGGRNHRFWCEF
jgi:hypothetical protein